MAHSRGRYTQSTIKNQTAAAYNKHKFCSARQTNSKTKTNWKVEKTIYWAWLVINMIAQGWLQSDKILYLKLNSVHNLCWQFVRNNSTGRQTFMTCPLILHVWSLQQCIKILILCRQASSKPCHPQHGWSPYKYFSKLIFCACMFFNAELSYIQPYTVLCFQNPGTKD